MKRDAETILGDISLDRLAFAHQGYSSLASDVPDSIYANDFREFCEKTLRCRNGGGESVWHIIRRRSASDRDAFWRFFDLLDFFLASSEVGPLLCLRGDPVGVNLNRHLAEVCQYPGMYLDRKSVVRLRAYLEGLRLRAHDVGRSSDFAFDYVAFERSIREDCDGGSLPWDRVLLSSYDGDDVRAFDEAASRLIRLL
jgi:hypothetical protein